MWIEARKRLRAWLLLLETGVDGGRATGRYGRMALSSLTGIAARGVEIVVGLVMIPVLLGYLGDAQYGLWVTITSLAAWAVLLDLGIVNGMVNLVAEANGRDDPASARSYVGTAFVSLSILAILLGTVFLVVAPRVPWIDVFAVRGQAEPATVQASITFAVILLLVALPLSSVRQIYAGYQRAYIAYAYVALSAVLGLGGVLLARRLDAGLPAILLAGGLALLVSYGLNWVRMLKRDMPWLRPKRGTVKLVALRRLLRTAVPLSLFQLGALLVNQTQPLVIAHGTSLETVADFSILTRLGAAVGGIILLTTRSFLPAFREAWERGEREWIDRVFRRMVRIRLVLAALAGVILVLGGNTFLRLWIPAERLQFGLPVWITLAIVVLAATWVTAYSDLLIVLDRIWEQTGLVLANGFSVVVLTLALAPRWGVIGALAGSGAFTILVLAWLMPLLARRIALSESTSTAP